MTKADDLKSWLRERGTVVKHEIMEYGVNHFYTRADRTVRDFCEQGIVTRLTYLEKIMQGYVTQKGKGIKEAVYKYREIQPRFT